MTLVTNLFAIARIATKRLWSNKALAVTLLVGWTAAVGLSISVPLYADAVNHRILREKLEKQRPGTPPFAFMLRYVGSWYGAVAWEDGVPVDRYISAQLAGDLGLPTERFVRHFRTPNLRLLPGSDTIYRDQRVPLDMVGVGFITGVADQIVLIEGAFPQEVDADDAAGVLVHQQLAEDLGLQVGEQYSVLERESSTATADSPVSIPVTITGVWAPAEPDHPFWFYRPSTFDRMLLTSESLFRSRFATELNDDLILALWYLILDGSDVYAGDVAQLSRRITAATTRVSALLPNTSLDISPADAIRSYRHETRLLTVLLAVFAIPVLSLVIVFVALSAGIALRQQRTELAVLRSRGMSRTQIVGVHLIEGMVLATLAMLLGLLLAQGIALAMGQVRSFLTLTSRPGLQLNTAWESLRFGAGALLLALAATLLPAFSAASHTVVTQKQEQARALSRPLWQRLFLDIFLLAPPLYGYYLLEQRGTISVNLGGGATSDPFQNPLLFLAPTLFIFALALLSIRLFPHLMSALAVVASWFPGAPVLLAFRHLARSSQQYAGPLMLLILTLGLAAFAASMASTLDGNLVDQLYYEVGGDLRLSELGDSATSPAAPPGVPSSSGLETTSEDDGPKYLFLPVDQHLDAEGVRGATRIGRFQATTDLPGGERGTLLGIDRTSFAKVGFFREDFAPDSAGALMNVLALRPNALLVHRGFLARNALAVGDLMRLNLFVGGARTTIPFVVAGAIDMFPTLFPGDGPFFVGNLDYTFLQLGDEYPYQVWLATEPGRDTGSLLSDLDEIGYNIVGHDDARALILQRQGEPSRQGLFGLLSAGFLAAAALTVLGFLLYTIFSFRQRFVQLGVLQAIGLSVSQLVAFLTGELLVLVLTGAVAGTGLGVWASRLFIPFYQVRGGDHSQIPPFIVRIAWSSIDQIYLVFGAMLLVGVVLMTILLIRMRVFEAIKLGEVA
jgi:putative ABC transport system permease protein